MIGREIIRIGNNRGGRWVGRAGARGEIAKGTRGNRLVFWILRDGRELTNVKLSSNGLSSLGIFSYNSINLLSNRASRCASAFRLTTYMKREIRVR